MPSRPMHPILNKPLEHSTLEKIWILFGRALTLRYTNRPTGIQQVISFKGHRAAP